jgi:hypothetical protein
MQAHKDHKGVRQRFLVEKTRKSIFFDIVYVRKLMTDNCTATTELSW